MNYIVYLTDKCNMNCKYCYEHKKDREISFENIKNLVDNIIRYDESESCVLSFYGGEPLLKFDLIKQTIEYINSQNKNKRFLYSMTTNGTLLNDEIIEYIDKNDFLIVQFSIDGIKESHDKNRVFQGGNGTFDRASENAKKVIERFHNTKLVANKVITKNNLKTLDQDVRYLFNMGFKEIYVLIDYYADWTDDDLPVFKEQLAKMSEVYASEMMKEKDVYISLFDEKIKTYIDDSYNCNDDCKMGMRTINVGTDGNFYPCMQFVGDERFVIGNCKDGIDVQARLDLIRNSKKEIDICQECDLKKRCKHTCPCRNYSLTGDVNGLSPIVCEFERIIIEISDRMAEKQYKAGSKLFIQKYYNKDYSMIRFLEDEIKKKNNK